MKTRYTIIAMTLLHASSLIQAYPTRITGQFLTGHDRQLAGFGDLMLPIIGQEDSMFYRWEYFFRSKSTSNL